jgi:adenine-specific DNA-methyltransferase
LNVIANIEGLTVGQIASNSIVHADCLEAMKLIPDNSIDLILTDPPYFKVKKEQWDRQWDTAKGFLDWLDLIAEQWQRILKPNGSLYCFASPRMAARVEVMLGERFNVLSNIRWIKDAGWHNKNAKEELRSYLTPQESIIFCEHYGADNIAKGEAGYGAKCDELRGFVFAPLADYLKAERDKAGWQNEDAKTACGHSPTSGCHWFDRSQWTLPTEKVYSSWQSKTDCFRREYEDLRREYEDLRREYEDLRREYEDLRRPFNVTAEVPYTDVWTYPTVQYYQGKHPCEKPIAMLENIILASSREGAIVLDSFAGSANTGKACINTNRQYICIEKDPHYFEVMRDRIANHDQNAPIKTKKPPRVPKGQLSLF